MTQSMPAAINSADLKKRFVLFVKAYYHQLAEGCGEEQCPNPHCKSSPQFEHGAAAPDALLQEAKTLAAASLNGRGFRFCAGYLFPLPAAALDIATREAFDAAVAAGGDAVGELAAATLAAPDQAAWMLYDAPALRCAPGDVFIEGGAPTQLPAVPGHPRLGGFLGVDLPHARRVLSAAADSSQFCEVVAKLLERLKEMSLVAPRKDRRSEAVAPSPWRGVLDAERAELADAEAVARRDPRTLLAGFLTLRVARLVVLLLECPHVRDNHALMAPLLTTIARLHSYLAAPLVAFFSCYDAPALQRIISAVQSYLTLALLEEETLLRTDIRFDTYMPAACIVLSILCEANFCAKPEGTVGYTEFYNDGINENVDAKSDFDQLHRDPHMLADPAKMARSLADEKKLQPATVQEVLLASARQYREGNPGLPEKFAVSLFPFVLDASFKHSLLQHHSALQQELAMRMSVLQAGLLGQVTDEMLFLVLRVERSNLLETTIREMNRNRERLRRQLRVQFAGEEGIDEGGVKKEFFQLLVRQLVDPSYGMFSEDSEHNVHWFRPRIVCSDNDIEFNLIGRIIGLAIYNQVILDINFPAAAFKKLLKIEPSFADLAELDPVVHKSLQALLAFDEAAEGATVEDVFARTFTYTHDVFGEKVEVELKPGGNDIPVTAENRAEYVELYTRYICSESIGKNFEEFSNGFYDVCGRQGELLRVFHPEELQKMVVGSSEFDLSELEKSTRYDGYEPTDEVVRNFWTVINEMNADEQRQFLKFSTGTDRLPIKGLRSLGFVIGKNGGDSDQLPTAHTCFNHLLIPEYSTLEKLREKLLSAIQNCQGFGLM